MPSPLETLLISAHKTDMVAHIRVHPDLFEELIALALGGRHPYAWRAAWLLWDCMEQNDGRLQPYVGQIIALLPHVEDGRQREFLMVLQRLEIAEAHQGRLFDECVRIWEALGKRPALRLNAFKVLFMLAQKQPELANEVLALTDDYYTETLTKGAKHSLFKLLKDKGIG